MVKNLETIADDCAEDDISLVGINVDLYKLRSINMYPHELEMLVHVLIYFNR